MEFTKDLGDLQGAMMSADNIHPFSSLTSRGGNKEKILHVVNVIQEVYRRHSDDEKHRKFSLYMVLNADFPIIQDMIDYDGIDQVAWTIPTIPICLLCEIFRNLKLTGHLFEIIAFCSPKFSLAVAEAFVTSIKYYTPQTSIQIVKHICSGIYNQLCRLHYTKLAGHELLNILNSNYNCFSKCVKYFKSPPNATQLDSIHKDEKYKHIGNCLYSVIQLIQDCLNHYTSKVMYNPGDNFRIYEVTHEKDSDVVPQLEFTINSSPNTNILEYINRCNIALLDECELLVREISVDIYCAWSEFDDAGQSMQQSIGELCHFLHAKLQKINVLSNHALVSMLREISKQPKPMEDVIKEADIETISMNVTEDGEYKKQWLHALMTNNSTLKEIHLLNQVVSNLDMLCDTECTDFLSRLYEHYNSSLAIVDEVKLIMIKLYKKCTLEFQCALLKRHFSGNKFSNFMQTSEFTNSLTEIFNKLVSVAEAEYFDVLSLFLQNPRETYNKIFEVAIENVHQKNLMLKIMKLLDEFKNHYYDTDLEPCIVKIIQEKLDDIQEKKTNNLVLFIKGLKIAGTIPTSNLLLLIVMPKLHKGLIDKNIPVIYIQCRLLQESFTTQELVTFRAPLLAMLAQVLHVVRWKIDTFNILMIPTLQLVIFLQKSIFNTYSDTIPENESIWLKSKIKNAKPLNMYYYRRLWNPPGKNFVEVLTGKPVNEKMDVEQLVVGLSQILSSTIEQEWLEIWNSLECFGTAGTLDIFHNALCLITMAQTVNHTEQSWACLLHCFRNFVYVVRYNFFKEPLTDEQLISVLHKIGTIENILKDENIQDLSAVLLPLFAYIAERKEDFTLNIPEFFETKSTNSKFKTIINKVFANERLD